MTPRNSRLRLSPFNISLFYLLIGVMWILVPNQILSSLFSDQKPFRRVEELNHVLFLIVTAWILYFLIKQSEAAVKRRQQSLRRVNSALKVLSDCNHILIRATDEQELMRDICRTIVDVGGYMLAWVGISERGEEKIVRPVAFWGEDKGYLASLKVSWADVDSGRGPTGIAMRNRKTVVVKDIKSDPRWEFWREKAIRHGFASSISLPLIAESEPIGALVILARDTGAFNNQAVFLLEGLAENLAYGIATIRMNSERMKVRQERKLLASVLEQANEGIMIFDGEGIIKYVNPAINKIAGHDQGEILGRNIRELQADGEKQKFYEVIWDTINKGENRFGNFVFSGVNSDRVEINATIWAVSEESGTSSYAMLIRDVSREVQLERQLRLAQKMEAIATLAGGIAHDFNNNLASIITCAEMARDDTVEGTPMRELLDVVLRAGYRGRNLVKQILTISCQEEQERQPVYVDQVVDECLQLLRASFPKSIEIQLNFAEDLGLVLADPTQIHQIIVNLCTNAAHSMREKGGVLEINLNNIDLDADAAQIHQDLHAGQYLRLTVRDTGNGMSRDIIERIFDPFFTTKGKAEGTGLGLSVIHGIVKNHHGAITVSSVPGHGSTFHVYLPRIDNARKVVLAEAPSRTPQGHEHILFVDDEEDVAFGCQRMLARLGYQVTVANSGPMALELFRSDPDQFDMVFTDLTMPNMTGKELAKEISVIKPGLPIILCTGLGAKSPNGMTSDDLRKFGIREMIQKPLSKGEMARTIRRVLNGGDDDLLVPHAHPTIDGEAREEGEDKKKISTTQRGGVGG